MLGLQFDRLEVSVYSPVLLLEVHESLRAHPSVEFADDLDVWSRPAVDLSGVNDCRLEQVMGDELQAQTIRLVETPEPDLLQLNVVRLPLRVELSEESVVTAPGVFLVCGRDLRRFVRLD